MEPDGYHLTIADWSGTKRQFGNFLLRASPTVHSVRNLAWCVEEPEGHGVILTGDGEPSGELIEMGRTSDHLLVAECSLPVGKAASGHMNAGQAGELAGKCRSRALVLTHLNPGVGAGEAGEEARKHFGGKVIVAEDGMVIEV